MGLAILGSKKRSACTLGKKGMIEWENCVPLLFRESLLHHN